MTINEFFQGRVSRSFLLRTVIPITYAIYFIGILIANLNYPGVYDWRYMVMSELGNAEANPNGFYFLVMGGFFLGFGLIPLIGYIYRRLSVICRATTFVGSMWFILGVVCLMLLGITTFVPNLPNRIHENLAILGLLGLIVAIFFWGFPMIKDRLRKYNGLKQFDVRLMVLGFGMMWLIIFGAAAGLLYVELSGLEWGWVSLTWLEYDPRPPVWGSLALWEWIVIFGLMLYLLLLILMIPEQVQPLPKGQS